MAGNNSLELEINTLFQEGHTLEIICAEIISKYEKSDVLSPSEIESISHFLTVAGRIDLLFKFYLKCLIKDSLPDFPWGSFAQAYIENESRVTDLLIDIMDQFFQSTKNFENAAMSPTLVNVVPEVTDYLANKKLDFEISQRQLKTKLITQLNHNRLYQLSEQEEQTLQQLVKIFPTDIEVKLLHQAHLEKKADDILARIRVPASQRYSKKIVEYN